MRLAFIFCIFYIVAGCFCWFQSKKWYWMNEWSQVVFQALSWMVGSSRSSCSIRALFWWCWWCYEDLKNYFIFHNRIQIIKNDDLCTRSIKHVLGLFSFASFLLTLASHIFGHILTIIAGFENNEHEVQILLWNFPHSSKQPVHERKIFVEFQLEAVIEVFFW